MKSYISSGGTLTLVAPYNVASGAGFLRGSIFAVATTTVLSGAPVEGKLTGEYELAKVSAQAWAVGDRIYWDDATRLATTVAAAGANKLIGVATAIAANPTGVGRVLLTGAFTL
jgi:predicted RecA/RadA family phage recombinase